MYDTGDDQLIILHSVNDDMLANFERASGPIQSIPVLPRSIYTPLTRGIEDDVIKILSGAGGQVNPHQGITSLLGTSPAASRRIADSRMRSRSSGV